MDAYKNITLINILRPVLSYHFFLQIILDLHSIHCLMIYFTV